MVTKKNRPGKRTGKITITSRMSPSTKAQVEEVALRLQMPMSRYIEEAVLARLKKDGAE